MLTLNNITKDYPVGDEKVHALRGISLSFRESEFVSILGPSGCGKTTLLNIIGGLDQYTTGDLIINGRSTKEYNDKDWDSYRNHSIGFVFQTYNLIPHQTVLRNVELALTLSGVSKEERKSRATEALKKVGLGDQLNKKPNQMSGGQMQRVAIARALVNDPDILLADEPTGALDTATSIQIMDILKEVSKDKLVIMVTHNPDLAKQYSSRIISVLDGQVTDDNNPLSDEEISSKTDKKPNHTSMSFFTALSLSLNNLMTKKARTFLTAFAGSIGIIGIALILSLSNGVNEYIDRVQEETLSTYPLMIQNQTADSASMISAILGLSNPDAKPHEDGRIYSSNMMGDIINTMMQEIKVNDLKSLKAYFDSNAEMKDLTTDIRYSYGLEPNVFSKDMTNGIYQMNPSTIMNGMYSALGFSQDSISEMSSLTSMSGMASGMTVWSEMISNPDLLEAQYDLVAGQWPKEFNEVVLVVDKKNEISDFTLYSLGLKNPDEIEESFRKMMKGEPIVSNQISFTYDELLNLTFRLALPSDYYQKNEVTGLWSDMSNDEAYMKALLTDDSRSVDLKIVGIIHPSEDAVATSVGGAIGYTHALTEYIVKQSGEREVVKQQLANPDIDVFTNLPFEESKQPTPEELRQIVLLAVQNMTDEERTQAFQMFVPMIMEDTTGEMDELKPMLSQMMEQMQTPGASASVSADAMAPFINALPEETIALIYKQVNPEKDTRNTYELNIARFAYADIDKPMFISIYPKDFESKDRISEIIKEYNDNHEEEQKIQYTDVIALLMSSISTIINAITYILIAFVAISLVVSSIMIGIITYISVLERTKEIGILRAIGASKRDISRVFNAETLIIGFVAGAIGIVVTLLLNIPINLIIYHYTDIHGLSRLPIVGGLILVGISMLLTLIAGLIPSRIASKKDPVTALRTE